MSQWFWNLLINKDLASSKVSRKRLVRAKLKCQRKLKITLLWNFFAKYFHLINYNAMTNKKIQLSDSVRARHQKSILHENRKIYFISNHSEAIRATNESSVATGDRGKFMVNSDFGSSFLLRMWMHPSVGFVRYEMQILQKPIDMFFWSVAFKFWHHELNLAEIIFARHVYQYLPFYSPLHTKWLHQFYVLHERSLTDDYCSHNICEF